MDGLEEKTLKLYHGTSSKFKDSILKKGLLPRKFTGNSNYKCIDYWGFNDIFESYDDRVYFTNSLEKAKSLGELALEENGGKLVVFEAEIDTENLVADEDSRMNDWYDSLNKFGTVAYVGIVPKEAINLIFIYTDS